MVISGLNHDNFSPGVKLILEFVFSINKKKNNSRRINYINFMAFLKIKNFSDRDYSTIIQFRY